MDNNFDKSEAWYWGTEGKPETIAEWLSWIFLIIGMFIAVIMAGLAFGFITYFLGMLAIGLFPVVVIVLIVMFLSKNSDSPDSRGPPPV